MLASQLCIQIAAESMSSILMFIPSFGLDIYRAVKSKPHLQLILVQLHCHYISHILRLPTPYPSEKLKHGWSGNVVNGCINAAILDCIKLSRPTMNKWINEWMNNYTPRCEIKDQCKYTDQRKHQTPNVNVNGMVYLLQELMKLWCTNKLSFASYSAYNLNCLNWSYLLCVQLLNKWHHMCMHVAACFLYMWCHTQNQTILVQCQTVISCLAS